MVIPGEAISFRSQKANSYKSRVRAKAREVFTKPLTEDRLEVYMDYFRVRRRRPDMDNIAKCVLDALTGLAYVDDAQVHAQLAKDHWLESPVSISGGPIDLVKPLREYKDYLFVRIRAPFKRLKRRQTKRERHSRPRPGSSHIAAKPSPR